MIFQKKIIIGSIMSFIATVVGVIAVFFPDLLNLQKKKIQELSILLYDKEDFQTLFDFLQQNKKRIVKLELGYCIDPNEQASVDEQLYKNGQINTTEEIYEKAKTKFSTDKNSPNGVTVASLYSPGADMPSTREKGTIYITPIYDKETNLGFNYALTINEPAEDGLKYEWWADSGVTLLSKEQTERAQNLCKANANDEFPLMGVLTGTFIYIPGTVSPEYMYDNLKPLSEADLQLRNY